MVKKILILCLMSIFLAGYSLQAGDESVAVTVKVRGKVSLTKANQAKSISVKKAQILNDQDKLQTGASSSCAIKFLDDKSLLRIRANSSCIIEAKKEKKKVDKNIIVQIGSFFASLFKPSGSFSVTTPTSVASVKGTKFWTIHFLDGHTVYICIKGLIDIVNDAGRVLLREGQTAVVTSRFKLPEVRLTQPGDIPEEEINKAGIHSLEFGFINDNGETKTLKIDIQEK